MQLTNLYTTLNDSIDNGVLTLNTSLIDEGEVSRFIGQLPGAALTTEHTILDYMQGPPHRLQIEGTLQGVWTLQALRNARLNNVRLRITFTQFDDTTVTGLLEITGSNLLTPNQFSINLQGRLRPEGMLHLSLQDKATTAIDLAPVISFANNTTLNYYIPPLPQFQSGVPGEFDLVFGLTKDDPYTFRFSTQPGGDWPITGQVAIKGVGFSFVTETKTPWDTKRQPSFHGAIFGTFHIDQDYTVIVGFNGPSAWALEVIPANGNILPGLDALGGFIGGDAVKQKIQSGIQAMQLQEVAIDNVRIAFDYNAGKLLGVVVHSHVTIAGIRVNVIVSLPDFQLNGSLADGCVISVKSIIQHHFNVSDKFPELNIDQLGITIQPGKGLYALTFSIKDLWKYEISPGKTLDLDSLAIDIQKSPNSLTGSLTAEVGLAGIVLSLSAKYSNDNGVSGWFFEVGTVGDEQVPIGKLGDDLASLFGVSLPDSLKDITLSNIDLTFNTASGDFTFTCTGHIPFGSSGSKADVKFDIKLIKGSDNIYTKDIAGKLTIGQIEFTFHINNSNTATYFLATFEQKGSSFNIHDAIQQISPDIAQLVPTGFTLSIDNAEIAILKTTAGTNFLVGIGLSITADLGSIPLIGSKLAEAHTLSFKGIQLYFANDIFTTEQLGVFNSPLLPKATINKGFLVTANLELGGNTTVLSLPVATTPPPATPSAPAGGGNTTRAVATTSNASQSSVRWFTIQRTLGPLSFQRIGVRYAEGSIWFLLDVSAQMGGLTFALNGLAAGSPLDHFDLKFHLSGMGLGYKSGPIAIEGAFLEVDPDTEKKETFHYDGDAILQLPDFTIGAVGALSNPQGQPSMFIFAELDAPIGGPPYFFVTGITGGFGYNSRVNLPDQDQVVNFPFVQGLQGQTNPMDVLDILEGRKGGKTWVEALVGNNWLAVGIHFTSFEFILGKALLIAEFGEQFEIALLGIMSLKLPQGAPQLYASVDLGLEARFVPAEGFFGLSAVISRNSFVIDPACRLTGGFALYTWFGSNTHAGDFVITLGGYHPQFPRPNWYPTEDRLGFSWNLSNLVSISGDAYFALTPSCIMGGGGLRVLFHDGDLQAWFIASANFLIYWKPFSFTADFGVSIGVSYRLSIFGIHKTFSIELGAQVYLWGPPTGGKAHISWFIISFTVEFGAQPESGQGQLDWDKFSQMLPADTSVCKIRISDGLQQEKKQHDNTTRWIVRSDELVFTSESAIPALDIQTHSKANVALADADLPTFNIRPMGVTNASSQQVLYIVDPNGVEIDPVAAKWDVQTINRSVPKALWGEPLTGPPPPSADLVPNNKTGLTIKAPQPTLGGTPGSIDMEKDLSYEPLSPTGQLPMKAAEDAIVPQSSATTISTIFNKLMDGAVVKNRDNIYQLLSDTNIYTGPNEKLDRTQKRTGSNFTEEPLLA